MQVRILGFIILFVLMLSGTQWLALTPPALVQEHLGFSDATIASLSKTKPIVIQG